MLSLSYIVQVLMASFIANPNCMEKEKDPTAVPMYAINIYIYIIILLLLLAEMETRGEDERES
jgi:hypothetical protein